MSLDTLEKLIQWHTHDGVEQGNFIVEPEGWTEHDGMTMYIVSRRSFKEEVPKVLPKSYIVVENKCNRGLPSVVPM